MALPKTFQAMVVTETEEKQFVRRIQEKKITELPEGEVLVQVLYSSLNYKDYLSATGNRGVTRKYPHTPGIDAAGIVAQSSDGAFSPGDKVIVTSYDLGMNTSGGYGQYIRVPSGWVVPQPNGLSSREAMIFGTAGFTAALSVRQMMEGGVRPEAGNVLVSGATGGVGSIAVSILSKLGYSVTAVNGALDQTDYLKSIGANDIISIDDATDSSGRPLLKSLWAGGIVASPELPINVYPFILRGVKLFGIDSQNCPMPIRRNIWSKLAAEWKIDWLDTITTEAPFEALDSKIELMRQRKHIGRTIIKMT